MNRVRISENEIVIFEVGRTAVLSGAPRGREMFLKLIELSPAEPTSPEPLYLDFRGIEVATASFLRESIVAYRDFIRGRKSKWYPVIANANPATCEDLLEVLRDRGGAIMSCHLEAGKPTKWSVLGKLEPKQQLTYDLVCQKGETDATELMRDQKDIEKLQHATGWNNRLAALVSLGIIIEISEGRSKRFRPLFSEVGRHGH